MKQPLFAWWAKRLVETISGLDLSVPVEIRTNDLGDFYFRPMKKGIHMTKSAKRKAHDARSKPSRLGGVPHLDSLPQVPLAPPYSPVRVDGIDMAFPTHVVALMPAYESIPEEYKRGHGTYDDLFGSWFFLGLSKFEPVLRDPAMDVTTCMGHIRCVMGSFDPSHQHKEAAVRMLLDTWFSSIAWESEKELSDRVKLIARFR